MSAAHASAVPSDPSSRDAAAEVPPLIVRHRGPLMVAVMAAMTMQMLDTTIANVALPHMQASLGATQETVTWVLTSYVLAAAVALPVAGWLVSRFGIKRVLIVSVTLFTISSVLCGLSQNLTQIVIFRVLQGLAGAFLAPLAQTVMLDMSTAAERPRMMSIFTQGVMLGPIAGPVLGGYLTDSFSWPWVFLVNVPIGIACVAALIVFLPRTPPHPRRFDLFGWLLIAVALSSLQLMLDRGPTRDWFGSYEIVAYAALCLCAGWMAAIHIATGPAPIFPAAMLRDRNLVAGIGFMFLVGLVMMSVMALLPVLLQSVYGYPAIDAGWLLTPRGLGMLASMTVFGRLMYRLDPRMLLALGLGIMAWSLWLMTGWSPDMPTGPIIFAGFVQGIGLSFTFMPLNVITFATLDSRLRTDASSLANLSRNLGASTGIAICTVLLSRNLQINHAEIGAHLTRGSIPFDLDRVTPFGDASQAALRVLDLAVNRQAAMIAYIDDFLLMGIACAAAIPVVLLLRVPPRPEPIATQLAAER